MGIKLTVTLARGRSDLLLLCLGELGHKVALAPVLLAELDAAGSGNRVSVLELALAVGGDGGLVGVVAGGGAVVGKVAAAVCGAVS